MVEIFRPKPQPRVPVGQEWVQGGYQPLPQLKTPTPCPLCGTIDCGVDNDTEREQAEHRRKQAEFDRLAEKQRLAEEAATERDADGYPVGFFDRITNW